MRFNLKGIYNNSKEYILFALLLILSLSLISLNSNQKIQSVKVLAFGSFAYINSLIAEPITFLNLAGELEEQRRLNTELMLENSLLRSQALENKKLQNFLQFKDSVDSPLRTGKIISRFGSVMNGKFLIDLGESDSIKSGMPVITEKGLVGIVELVSRNFSVVNHLYNNDLSFAVVVRETNTEGLINWNGEKLVIDNVPTTTLVKPGYEVYTSDFSTIFPPSIPVGKVIRTETTIAGLLSKVEIEAFESIESINRIFVVLVKEQDDVKSVEETTN